MKKELKLLIVEDDNDFIKSYERQIKLFNREEEDIVIQQTIVSNVEDATDVLLENEIEAAVVDLKLGTEDIEYSGNTVIGLIKSNQRFPAFILTANPEKIEEEKGNENDFYKVKVKGSEEGNFTAILNELKAIHLTGITDILGKSGKIEQQLSEIFWKHLSNSINIWMRDDVRTPEQKEQSLLRYTLLHVQEYLELSEESSFDNYHPAEAYITPPIKPNIFTGDIVKEKKSESMFIVLTPSCDLAQCKAKDIMLVQIESNSTGLINEKKNIIKKGKAKAELIEEAENTLGRLLHNAYSNKYHFLPQYNEIEGGLINFQKAKSVKVKSVVEEYERIASLNSHFTKDVVARFSYYYSRQGSPDFDTKEIYEALF